MANFHAIAATSQALLSLLKGALPGPGAPAVLFPSEVFDGADIALMPSANDSLPDKGIAICLYRMGPNASRRYLPPPTNNGRRRRPAVGLDLYYALLPLGKGADTQQRLLGWAIRTLEDIAVLPENLLNGHGLSAFNSGETVELIFEGLSVQDLSALWENVKPQPLLVANYIARLVTIDSTIELVQVGDVQTREFELRRIVTNDSTINPT